MRRRPRLAGALLASTALVIAASATPSWADAPRVVDDFEAGLPQGMDGTVAIGFNTFQDPNSTVAIATTEPPAAVPDLPADNLVAEMAVDVAAYGGFTHSFEGPDNDTWVHQDWSTAEGVSFWLYGNNSGTTLFFDVLDNRANPDGDKDDAERFSTEFVDDFSGWQLVEIPFASLGRKEIGNGAPNDGLGLTEVHGWALGAITTPAPQTFYLDNVSLYGVAPERELTAGFSSINYAVTEGQDATITVKLSKAATELVTVGYASTIGDAEPERDYHPVQGLLEFLPGTTQQSFTVRTIDDDKYRGERSAVVEIESISGGAAMGLPPIARILIEDDESADPNLVEDFESQPHLWSADGQIERVVIDSADADSRTGQAGAEGVLKLTPDSSDVAGVVRRDFAAGQDWSGSQGLQFWYRGRGDGGEVEVSLGNAEASYADPSQWELAWSDEFDGSAGESPDPDVWLPEVGDGTAAGIPGWGNDERQYYTDEPSNVAHDGQGHLAVTVLPNEDDLLCNYGVCDFTSARLITQDRLEVAYGRVEARVQVPSGSGLWPAFWMLGTDIDTVGWPQTGEIDVMEHVARLPEEIFGTVHGPGYSGGQSYGKVVDLGEPVADQFHTYAVDWTPNSITWLLDGEPYFTATPDDPFLAGKEWVFNHPFFLLLNVAVGGNFGGTVDPDLQLPATTLYDYVRVYQPSPSVQSYSATFADTVDGWQLITLPFSDFTGAGELDASAVTSMAWTVPAGSASPVLLDEIRTSCAADAQVASLADDGPGSLRSAVDSVCAGGVVTFDPSLTGETIELTSGPITFTRPVEVDASSAPNLTVSGGGQDRVFIVDPAADVTLTSLVVSHGRAADLGGGILNNGTLTLDRVAVTDNVMTTEAGDFWKGGGGIYVGEGASLVLEDSSVSGNRAAWSGAGIYGFLDSDITIVRSTISGNSSDDVGGGLRSAGDVSIVNSTISGNTSAAWHGGAIFHTDGDLRIESSTVAFNAGPASAPSAIFVGSWTDTVPTLVISSSIVSANSGYACETHASGGQVEVASEGFNVLQDDTCGTVASDTLTESPGLDELADNGGPTWTHLPAADSPAINAGNPQSDLATDQRGESRPAGPAPDAGAVELQAEATPTPTPEPSDGTSQTPSPRPSATPSGGGTQSPQPRPTVAPSKPGHRGTERPGVPGSPGWGRPGLPHTGV